MKNLIFKDYLKVGTMQSFRRSFNLPSKSNKFTIDDFDADYQLHQDMNTEHCMALSKTSSPEMISAVR